METDGGACFQAGQVHGNGTVGRQTQGFVAVAPVLDEGNVGMGDCG